MLSVGARLGSYEIVSLIGAGFEQRYSFGSAQTVPNYDVSADGQRFVLVKDDSSFGRLSIVLNWFDELRRLAPAK
jgi:hypothetical protein